MSNLTKISWKRFTRKCTSYNWYNGPIRLQYMPTLWLDISSIQFGFFSTSYCTYMFFFQLSAIKEWHPCLIVVSFTMASRGLTLFAAVVVQAMTDVAYVDLVLNNLEGLKLKHQRPHYHTIWFLNLKPDERDVSLLLAYPLFTKKWFFTIRVVF